MSLQNSETELIWGRDRILSVSQATRLRESMTLCTMMFSFRKTENFADRISLYILKILKQASMGNHWKTWTCLLVMYMGSFLLFFHKLCTHSPSIPIHLKPSHPHLVVTWIFVHLFWKEQWNSFFIPYPNWTVSFYLSILPLYLSTNHRKAHLSHPELISDAWAIR